MIAITEAIQTLQLLLIQLDDEGVVSTMYEEIILTDAEVRLRRNGKTLRVPCVKQ